MQLDLFGGHTPELSSGELTKTCKYCEKSLPLHMFKLRYKGYKPVGTRGRDHICKTCCKESSKKLRQLKVIAPPKPLDKKCQCCGVAVDTFFFDHCHKTDEFRGWICRSCNVGLGFLGDNVEGIEKALTYLRKVNE